MRLANGDAFQLTINRSELLFSDSSWNNHPIRNPSLQSIPHGWHTDADPKVNNPWATFLAAKFRLAVIEE